MLTRTDREPARKLIAVRMTAAASRLDPAVRERVKGIEAGMFPPRTEAEVKALAELGDEVIDKPRFSASMAVEQQIMCAATLVQIGTPKARTGLEAFAPTATNWTLIEKLSRAVDPLRIPHVQTAVAAGRNRLPAGVARQITDRGLVEWLASGPSTKDLTMLSFRGTRLTDAGVKELARADTGLQDLRTLNLDDIIQVTDAGVKELTRADTGLMRLTELWLIGTQVTDAGKAAIKARFPKARVFQ